MTTVTVALRRNPDRLSELYLYVKVDSVSRPGLGATNDIAIGPRGVAELTRLVGVAAAAGAEYLSEKYGDNLDPAATEIAAKQALGREAQKYADLTQARQSWALRALRLAERMLELNRTPDRAGNPEVFSTRLFMVTGLSTLLNHYQQTPTPLESEFIAEMETWLEEPRIIH